MPYNIPGSFKFKNKSGESIGIHYTIECFIEDMEDEICGTKEITVREFFFTDEEIEDDWKNYEKIMNLKSVLKPHAARIATDETAKLKK